MKCTISATEPSILRDAKPGQLFMLWDSRERECVFALLDPAAPYRQVSSGEISMLKIVVIACRVDEGEPGYHAPGTQLWMSADIQIQFVEQTQEAQFSARNVPAATMRINVIFGGGGCGRSRGASGSNGSDSLRDAGEFTEPAKPGDQL